MMNDDDANIYAFMQIPSRTCRLALAAIVLFALFCAVSTMRAEALARDGSRHSCSAATADTARASALPVSSAPRDGQVNYPAPCVAGFGVTTAGAVRGSGAGNISGQQPSVFIRAIRGEKNAP